MVLIFIYPGVTKKTKINAHELEALRFFFPRSEHTQNTHYRQGALGWATASRWATASQRQGRAGGRAGCTLCGCGWLRACTHAPCEHQLLAVRRADERSGPDMSIFGSRLAATCYRQVRLACVCVRARKHVGTNFIPALTHTVIICVCVCVCVCVCMYVCMYVKP